MTDAQKVALWVRAYRRARAAVGKSTHSTDLDKRLDQYHKLWTNRYKTCGWAKRFASPKMRIICEYLMCLIDMARDGTICSANPAYYSVMDETLEGDDDRDQ